MERLSWDRLDVLHNTIRTKNSEPSVSDKRVSFCQVLINEYCIVLYWRYMYNEKKRERERERERILFAIRCHRINDSCSIRIIMQADQDDAAHQLIITNRNVNIDQIHTARRRNASPTRSPPSINTPLRRLWSLCHCTQHARGACNHRCVNAHRAN